MINLRPVESSMISHIGFDEPSQVLRVQFTNGVAYEYDGVTKAEHEALVKAPSIGKHFHSHIRKEYVGKKAE